MSKKKTIYKKMRIPFILLLVFEAVMLYIGLDNYSIEDELQNRSIDAIEAKLCGTSGILQEKMKEQWADVLGLAQQVNKQADAYLKEKAVSYLSLIHI